MALASAFPLRVLGLGYWLEQRTLLQGGCHPAGWRHAGDSGTHRGRQELPACC